MSTDLHARAIAQQDLLNDAAAAVADALASARAEVQRRHPDPGSVLQADWAAELGATQHQQVARGALAAVRAAQATTRTAIAAIANPADAETYEEQLRDLLVDEAALRVELRLADERVAAGNAVVAALTALSARAEGEVAGAGSRTAWAKEHTELGQRLRDALDEPPLDTVVADAGAALAGAAFSDADDRLDELLPADLRARAEQRAAEAEAAAAAAADAATRTRGDADTLAEAADPIGAPIAVAQRNLLEAERALAAYEGGAAGRLAWAAAVLARIEDLPDLSLQQIDALDPANNADGVTAAAREADLATAVADVAAAQRAVDDAMVDAILADPDADPETDQGVIDARDALADGAIQDPLADARAAYDQASRSALDAWEVEVPPDLWAALDEFVEARRALQGLASGADRTALVDALGDAEDTLAAALDEHDVAVRARWALGLADATRAGALAAASTSAGDRRRQYLQGDGPSGRVPAEL